MGTFAVSCAAAQGRAGSSCWNLAINRSGGDWGMGRACSVAGPFRPAEHHPGVFLPGDSCRTPAGRRWQRVPELGDLGY